MTNIFVQVLRKRLKVILISVILVFLQTSCSANEINGIKATLIQNIRPTPIAKNTSTLILPTGTVTQDIFLPRGEIIFDSVNSLTRIYIQDKLITKIVENEHINYQPVSTDDGNTFFLSDSSSDHGIFDLYRINLLTLETQRLTDDKYYDYSLTSCYFFNVVAFISDRHETEGNYKVFVSGLAGSNKPKLVLSEKQGIQKLSCSNNGKYLAFIMGDDVTISGDLFILDIYSGKAHQLTQNQNTSDYSWSPDSKNIVFINESQNDKSLTIIDVNNKGYSKIYEPQQGLFINNPLWSPDGKKILFELYNDSFRKLVVVDENGKNEKDVLKPVYENLSFSYNAVWSPDGKYIAYALKNLDNLDSLYILHLGNGIKERITANYYSRINSINWFFQTK